MSCLLFCWTHEKYVKHWPAEDPVPLTFLPNYFLLRSFIDFFRQFYRNFFHIFWKGILGIVLFCCHWMNLFQPLYFLTEICHFLQKQLAFVCLSLHFTKPGVLATGLLQLLFLAIPCVIMSYCKNNEIYMLPGNLCIPYSIFSLYFTYYAG